jgi:ABC-type antimicrobial peptide transport system permease subunit
MLNERAVAALDMTPEEIVGRQIFLGDEEDPTPITVSGVVADFNFESLYRPIAPQAFINNRGGFYQIVRMAGGNRAENVAAYKQLFNEHFPNDMFDPHYIKEELDAGYSGVKKTEHIIVLFTLLAIFMACMGVFALTAFLVEQRTKEIGIRRVLGSSVGGILGLFAKTYLKLLGIALLIAIPAGIFVCNNYLSTFAYHITPSWWMFAAAAGITLVLVLIAVVAPTFKAANADPVKNLQYE